MESINIGKILIAVLCFNAQISYGTWHDNCNNNFDHLQTTPQPVVNTTNDQLISSLASSNETDMPSNPKAFSARIIRVQNNNTPQPITELHNNNTNDNILSTQTINITHQNDDIKPRRDNAPITFNIITTSPLINDNHHENTTQNNDAFWNSTQLNQFTNRNKLTQQIHKTQHAFREYYKTLETCYKRYKTINQLTNDDNFVKEWNVKIKQLKNYYNLHITELTTIAEADNMDFDTKKLHINQSFKYYTLSQDIGDELYSILQSDD